MAAGAGGRAGAGGGAVGAGRRAGAGAGTEGGAVGAAVGEGGAGGATGAGGVGAGGAGAGGAGGGGSESATLKDILGICELMQNIISFQRLMSSIFILDNEQGMGSCGDVV